MKQAVTKMVQECCKWISEGTLPSKDVELELISTLRTVTEGKIYVEVERARMTHRLSKMKEEEGLVEEASKIMQELQVETYGSMDRKEKVNNICTFLPNFCSKSKIALIKKKIEGPLKKWTEHSLELHLLKIHSRGAPITPRGWMGVDFLDHELL